MPRLHLSLIAILILAAATWSGVMFLEANRPEPGRLPPREVGEVPVQVRRLEGETLPLGVRAFGTLVAAREAGLALELGGQVANCLDPWNVGRFVAADTLLVSLDPTLADEELRASEAARDEVRAALEVARVESAFAAELVPLARESLELAQREENRLGSLSAGSIASASQIDNASQARAAAAIALGNARAREAAARAGERRALESVRAAEAQVGLSRERRARLDLRAPFSGYLAERGPAIGSYLVPGQAVATLIDANDLRVVLDIPEEDFVGIEIGQLALLRSPAHPGDTFEGRVVGVGVRATSTLRALPVEVRYLPSAETEQLPSQTGEPLATHVLRSGQFVDVHIATGVVDSGLAIKRDELVWHDGLPVAFVMVASDGGARVEARQVTIGAEIEGGLWITAGLAEGEWLITAPIGRLNGGEACEARENGD